MNLLKQILGGNSISTILLRIVNCQRMLRNQCVLAYLKGLRRIGLFHIITARWQIVEDIGIRNVSVHINDESRGTYSRNAKSWRNPQVAAGGGRGYNHETGEVTAELVIPDYYQNGNYLVHYISMIDFAGNRSGVYFSNFDGGLWETDIKLDELPASIYVPTINPDNAPVVLDLNNIMIKAEPTRPEDPNGETIVDITFRVKDNISGYWKADLRLRDPLGNIHQFTHFHPKHNKIYFHGDSKVYENLPQTDYFAGWQYSRYMGPCRDGRF